jgi:hypothetical protein
MYSGCLVLLYDPPALNSTELHEYFQNFIEFIELNIVRLMFFLWSATKKPWSDYIELDKFYEILEIFMKLREI